MSDSDKIFNNIYQTDNPYRSLFLNNPDLCYLLNTKGEFIELNEVAFQKIGYPLDDILNHSFLKIITPEDGPKTVDFFYKVLQGQRVSLETSIINFNGFSIPLLVTAMPFIENDEVVGIIGIAKDVTEIKLIQKRLNESKKRYKELVFSSPYPIIVSLNKEIVFVNEKAVKVMQAEDFTQLTGKNLYSFITGDESKEELSLKPLKSGELKVKTLSGEVIQVQYSFTNIVWEGAPAFLIVFSDITERKQREKLHQQELSLAHQVQQNILPKSLNEEKIKINAIHLPSAELSGDMYYWTKMEEHLYGVMILDIMGHGVSSSLISMSVRAILPSIIYRHKNPTGVMAELNQYVHQYFNNMNFYMTGIFCLIDTRLKKIQYVNAGHPLGLLLMPNNQITELNRGGIPIGLTTEIIYNCEILEYELGSKLTLYTDGYYDALGVTVNQGATLVSDSMKLHKTSSPDELLDHFKDNIKSTKQPDDICMIVIDLP
ncbi:sigma-B regulation protein RsbU (phosphoserine phosphatase) [Bacillus mesophilus]|uniref:SpoIIE family protein phosphatase n=1 Tax=Bacillus mesophilus TaxID=1808955 RepID=A0A6M0Q500_9BACI|nr:SpoIIE family protein phosphatase [Bacillus mesophilus]MBM7660019.1 sigma-B regulation protein RsbU (phosphoserine phosphatase) [Bacillus mesophilus]NEY70879.1 SpoIIE family protein phosphatase [Bacillus mesophilus]